MIDDGERDRRIARTWAAVWRCQRRVQGGDRSVLATLGRYANRLTALTGQTWYMEMLFDLLHDGEHRDPAHYAALYEVDKLLAEMAGQDEPQQPTQPRRRRWMRPHQP